MTIINQVCVIGAGVMGSGIAAQVANSGTRVLLLDIASKDQDRNSVARASVAKMHQIKPPTLSHPKRAELISIGNLDDDLEKIKNCQFVIEVIVEKLDVKHSLYNKLLPYLHPEAIMASNTSTLPLKHLKENLPKEVASRFMITHFFNPPRYMPLLELITDKTTDLKAVETVSWFVTHRLGKSIVRSNDTPGFIANRIGCFLLELVLRKTIHYKLNVATVDHFLVKKLSLPSTGIFGLYDLIGLDVMGLIAKSLFASLPSDDRFVQIYTEVSLLQKMIADGYTGRKGRGGFYRMREEGGKKIKEVIDLESGEYQALSIESDPDGSSQAIAEILSEFESYVRSLVPEVTDKPVDIDRAMKLGYSWKYGPFELFNNSINSDRLDHERHEIQTQAKKESHSGDNIFDIATKMNCLTADVFSRLIEAVKKAEASQKPLYIYSEASNFSAGADLKFLLQKIQDKDWDAIEDYLKLGQKAMMCVKNAKVPVIACARGVALGGGCELLLHSHFVVAHQQLSAGLVEASLGLIPAFGGTKEMVLRAKGDAMLQEKLLGNIVRQNKSASADYFSEDYMVPLYINMNQDYLLEEAIDSHKKQTNIEWNAAPSHNRLLVKPISADDLSLDAVLESSTINGFGQKSNDEQLDEHTQMIAQRLQGFGGSSMSEDALLTHEREIFMDLVKMPFVEERIKKVIG